ncbi:tol-pal system protein YbgF [Sulfuriflexus mobilis]|uniref:tol-pal system protein YbgF n=1 Tax=Sulfuriflexus mobilis TaxID=1811807 RepID=UPI000F83069F|nr:tol-pal system protein YbgF [Sulfuriflexus mobilis]
MTQHRYSRAGLLAALLCSAGLLLATPVHADESLEKRVERMEKLLESQGLVDLYLRLEALQQEVQQLRGDVEQQGFAVNGIKQRQRDLYLDIDRRLGQLETGRAPSATAPAPATSPAPRAAAAGNPAAEESAYREAFGLLKEGRYKPAQSRFADFVVKYPASVYADNAQYWIGEVNYVTRAFEQAIVEFNKVLNNYPNSQKQADALLKIGYCYYELKDFAKARESLQAVESRFPDSTAARLASTRLQQLKTEGQ